jgi:hypothetical protein
VGSEASRSSNLRGFLDPLDASDRWMLPRCCHGSRRGVDVSRRRALSCAALVVRRALLTQRAAKQKRAVELADDTVVEAHAETVIIE